MELDELVNLFKDCGYRIKKIDGQYFLSRGWINYSFPQLSDVPIHRELVGKLKWRYLISVIKINTFPKNTHEFIVKTNEYHIDMLPHRARSTTRKSLRECEFKQPSLPDLLKFGLHINRQTMKLQHRNDKFLTDEKKWERYVTSLYGHKDVAMLGAYYSGQMIGYIIAFKMNGKYHVMNQYVDRSWPGLAPLNGLIYTLFNKIIADEGMVEFSDGMESFNPLPELNRFKRTMLFERVPATRIYVINPIFLGLLKIIILYYVRILGRKKIKNQFVQKVVRLYHGHRILCKAMA
jgi:hypothetical protein